MVLFRIFALLAAPVLLYASDNGFEELYQYVEDYQEVINNFVEPKENVELLNVTDDTVHSLGSYDFIIVGAGAAGCTLANRLSEIKGWKILLLEAGGEQNDFSLIPGFTTELIYTPMNWGYYSTPQTTACLGWQNNSCQAARGKVLGGSSTINLKLYVRGNRNDFDNWASLGNQGWSYDEVLPYFIQMENSHIYNADKGYHGHSGELDVNYTEPSPWTNIHIDAMKEIGFSVVDYNGESQIGTSQSQLNIRSIINLSGAIAFLDPIRHTRKNLEIQLNAFVTKIGVNISQNATSGVEFFQNGKRFVANATKEVILSAGAFNTPQILMLSGIGPREELDRHGIETLLDLPVGKNMVDHVIFTGLAFKTNVTAYNDTLRTLLKDYLHGHRPLTTIGGGDTCSFFNSIDGNSSQPNCLAASVVAPGFQLQKFYDKGNLSNVFNENYNPYSDIFFLLFLLTPKSRGTLTLQSASPVDFPLIDFNYFSDPAGDDLEGLYMAILKLLSLLDTEAYKAVNGSLAQIITGCDDYEEHSREWWYCALRIYSISGFHPSGTARMGVSAVDSVVDPKLLVHGMKKLRVVDASVMPEITSGNIAAPIFMIANKISHLIKKHYIADTT